MDDAALTALDELQVDVAIGRAVATCLAYRPAVAPHDLSDEPLEFVGVEMPDIGMPLEIGRGRLIREGSRVALLSLGTRLGECLAAAELLAAQGIQATVADARFAKPLDLPLIRQLARHHEALITVEEGSIGGFGSFVMHALSEEGLLDKGLKFRTMVLPDLFLDHDKPERMYAAAGLDAKSIAERAARLLGRETAALRLA